MSMDIYIKTLERTTLQPISTLDARKLFLPSKIAKQFEYIGIWESGCAPKRNWAYDTETAQRDGGIRGLMR